MQALINIYCKSTLCQSLGMKPVVLALMASERGGYHCAQGVGGIHAQNKSVGCPGKWVCSKYPLDVPDHLSEPQGVSHVAGNLCSFCS